MDEFLRSTEGAVYAEGLPVPTAKPSAKPTAAEKHAAKRGPDGHRPQVGLKAKAGPKKASSAEEQKEKIEHRRYLREDSSKDWNWDLEEEQKAAAACNIPWDKRGPPGPDQNGPTKWRNQKFRQGSCRWANNGGRDKAKWKLFFQKKGQKLFGADLEWYHPRNANGYWADEIAEKAAAEAAAEEENCKREEDNGKRVKIEQTASSASSWDNWDNEI